MPRFRFFSLPVRAKDLEVGFYEAVLRDADASAAGPPETVWVVGEFKEEEAFFQRLQQAHPGSVKKAVSGLGSTRKSWFGCAREEAERFGGVPIHSRVRHWASSFCRHVFAPGSDTAGCVWLVSRRAL